MADILKYPLLAGIDNPTTLKTLEQQQLPALCDELRQYLIESVAETGGHLGASLGTVELTTAIHYVYETPVDPLIWDVGHQTYPHKILTGRAHQMHSMRKKDGLAGFTRRGESPYDAFGVGHSSTSISAALGMALAARHNGSDERVVAVIGDGALTAGLAFEALNHAGDEKVDMLVILNDNDMSISPNVGALNNYLARILSGRLMTGARESSKRMLKRIPSMLEFARRTEEHVKGMVVPCTLFEELGFNYFGPVDGHDVESLVEVLRNLRSQRGPVFLHVVTEKGKGYRFAEEDPLALHATAPFDPDTGKVLTNGKRNSGPTYTAVFGQWLCDMAEDDDRLIGITPAMREGSGLVEFERRFPERYFDVGIAEQHAVTLAAGMACQQLKPVVAIYSTFLQRAYDQLIHDVAIQNLPVLFAIDRAGLVGPDGPTHAGSFDFSYLRCIPNMLIMAPADENECRHLLTTGFLHDGPAAVRYPRGSGPGVPVDQQLQPIPVGTAQLRRQAGPTIPVQAGSISRIAILAFGTMVSPAQAVAEQLDATLVNMRFIKPLDTSLIRSLANSHDAIVTVEENVIAGGAGAGVAEWLDTEALALPTLQIGLPDIYQEHGSREELLAEAGLDTPGIERQIRQWLDQLNAAGELAPASPVSHSM